MCSEDKTSTRVNLDIDTKEYLSIARGVRTESRLRERTRGHLYWALSRRKPHQGPISYKVLAYIRYQEAHKRFCTGPHNFYARSCR